MKTAENEKRAGLESSEQKTVKKVVIVGLPNTGKSQTFNNLTGEYTVVANYPLTTVEIKKARCKIEGNLCEIVDTPGLHCLYIHSEEELIVRDLIFTEKPDVVVQCIDANQLKQSLTLTADLLDMGIPMVISLNSIDETARHGIRIESEKLSQLLGVTVVEQIAMQGRGTKELKQAIIKARSGRETIKYGDIAESIIFDIESKLPDRVNYRRKVSLLLLLSDPFIKDYLEKASQNENIDLIMKDINLVKDRFRGSPGHFLNSRRNHWIDDITENVIKKQKIYSGQFSRVFAGLCRHPIFGIPILGFFLLITYLLVVNAAGFLEGQLSAFVVDPTINYISNLIKSEFWNDFLVGHYGLLTLGLFNAICTVLPILTVFFLMFGFLEDIGYIPNLCVLSKRFFEKIGLTGKSIMPIILGFSCKTMATLVTKGLQSRKEKFIAVYLIAFAIPCSAQMGIAMGILGRMGFSAFIIAYGALVLVEIGAGFILNKVIKEQDKSYLIQELPVMRLPSIKAIFVKT
ncbi:MAG: ferrous iron transporter B, partial [bacterium]